MGSWLEWIPGFESVRQAYDLAPQAMAGGLFIAGCAGAVGVVLRWRRLIWAGLAVPETATVGTAFALGHVTLLPQLGITAVLPDVFHDRSLLVILATAIAALLLVPIGRAARRGQERAAAACFLSAAALSVLLLSQDPHGTEEMRALSEGKTLLFLDWGDVRVLAGTMPAIALVTVALARPLAAIAFDRDHARAVGYPVVRLEAAFAVLFGGLVALAAPRVGAPFLFACLTLPPAAAERVAARPTVVVLTSVAVALVGSLLGATLGAGLDLPYATAAVAGVVVGAGALVVLAVPARAVAEGLRDRARRSGRRAGPDRATPD